MLSEALHNIFRISRYNIAYRAAHLPAPDLTPAQCLYISHVCRMPGATQEQLARAICTDKTTAAHQLSTLERCGYVERRVSARDGRCRCVFPTEKALAVFPVLRQQQEAFTDAVLACLSAEECAELTRLTALVCGNAAALLQDAGTRTPHPAHSRTR